MAKTKDEIAIERDLYLKTVRSIIRLKYSLMADREIARVVPPLMAAYDEAVANGKLLALDHTVLDEVLNALPAAAE